MDRYNLTTKLHENVFSSENHNNLLRCVPNCCFVVCVLHCTGEWDLWDAASMTFLLFSVKKRKKTSFGVAMLRNYLEQIADLLLIDDE